MTDRRINKLVKIGILSAIAFLFQLIGSMIGLKIGGFLEIEFSDLPALIGALALGPLAGIAIETIKNLLHCTITSTGFVGEFANLVINGVFVATIGIIYKINRTKKGAMLAMAVGVLFMAFVGCLANLFVMLPLYMPNADIQTRLNIVLYTILPFNLAKGTVLSVITILCYKKISPILKFK